MKTHRKPDFRLKFLNKQTEGRGEIAAGWLNEGGSITIVLNPMVAIKQDKDILLTLFPATRKP